MLEDYERIEMLEEAREAIKGAVQLIRLAIEGTGMVDYAEAYVIPSLLMCAGSQAYLGGQPANVDELIESFSSEDEA